MEGNFFDDDSSDDGDIQSFVYAAASRPGTGQRTATTVAHKVRHSATASSTSQQKSSRRATSSRKRGRSVSFVEPSERTALSKALNNSDPSGGELVPFVEQANDEDDLEAFRKSLAADLAEKEQGQTRTRDPRRPTSLYTADISESVVNTQKSRGREGVLYEQVDIDGADRSLRAPSNGHVIEEEFSDPIVFSGAEQTNGRGNGDVQLAPSNVPHGFMDNVRSADGGVNFDALQSLAESAQKNKRIKRTLQPAIGMDDEDQRVNDDLEGFIYETCMNPKEYQVRARLRKRANRARILDVQRRRAEAANRKDCRQLPAPTEPGNDAPPQEIVLSDDLDDDFRNVEDEFAEGLSHTGCLLCRRGTQGTAPIPIAPLENLIRNYVNNRGYKDEEELAYDLEEQFEKCIRTPANRNRKAGEAEIPLMTAEDVYYHMKYHDPDPNVWLCNTIRNLEQHAEQILHSGVYRVPRTATRPESFSGPANSYMNSGDRYKKIRKQDVRVNEKYHKMYLDTIKTTQSLYRMAPESMFLYNKYKAVQFNEVKPWINAERPMFTKNNPKKDIWANVKNAY